MTTSIIIQARMSSTRLPGKVMAPVMGRPLLAYQIERLQRARLADRVVVATTHEPTDDRIVALSTVMGADVFRGSQEDVLDRFFWAARAVDAQTIVRVTADCPLIDPVIVDDCIRFFHEGEYDWMAPENLPDGMGMDVFSRDLLETMHEEATEQPDREHVTLYAIRRATRFRLGHTWHDPDLSLLRWTVDYQADLDLVTRIFEALYPARFGLDDILWTLMGHPEWSEINRGVEGTVFDRTPILT